MGGGQDRSVRRDKRAELGAEVARCDAGSTTRSFQSYTVGKPAELSTTICFGGLGYTRCSESR